MCHLGCYLVLRPSSVLAFVDANQKSTFNPNWRIRASSSVLVGRKVGWVVIVPIGTIAAVVATVAGVLIVVTFEWLKMLLHAMRSFGVTRSKKVPMVRVYR